MNIRRNWNKSEKFVKFEWKFYSCWISNIAKLIIDYLENSIFENISWELSFSSTFYDFWNHQNWNMNIFAISSSFGHPNIFFFSFCLLMCSLNLSYDELDDDLERDFDLDLRNKENSLPSWWTLRSTFVCPINVSAMFNELPLYMKHTWASVFSNDVPMTESPAIITFISWLRSFAAISVFLLACHLDNNFSAFVFVLIHFFYCFSCISTFFKSLFKFHPPILPQSQSQPWWSHL